MRVEEGFLGEARLAEPGTFETALCLHCGGLDLEPRFARSHPTATLKSR